VTVIVPEIAGIGMSAVHPQKEVDAVDNLDNHLNVLKPVSDTPPDVRSPQFVPFLLSALLVRPTRAVSVASSLGCLPEVLVPHDVTFIPYPSLDRDGRDYCSRDKAVSIGCL